MPDKVKIGFVGVGMMGQCAHLRNYAVLPDCEVTAIAELRDDVREKVAARYGISKTYPSAAEMLANEKLDGIVASQQFKLHGSILPELLSAGVPIFIEKPLARSVETGEKITEAVSQSGTWIMVGYHKQSDPAVMWAVEEIGRLKASGEIGSMRYVRIVMPAGSWIANGAADLIRGEGDMPVLEMDPPAAGMDEETENAYRSFVNYYIHQVNLMRHLLGEPYTVTYADPSGVLLAGLSAGGTGCAIEMSPYRTTRDWQETALVGFDRGYLRLTLPAPLVLNRAGMVEAFKDPGKESTPETISPVMPQVHAMKQQAENFIRAIRGEMKPLCEVKEALEDLKTAREYIRLLKGV